MFEVVFLGTSAHMPTIKRNLTTSLIIKDEDRYLIDCAEETQRQILSSPLGLRSVQDILLTHDHSNHIIGLGGLISTIFRWEILSEVRIYGGRKTIELTKHFLQDIILKGRQTTVKIRYIVLTEGIFIDKKSYSVSAIPVKHGDSNDSFAFLFEEKTHRPFHNDIADELGIPWGPIRKRLVNGETVLLDNGLTVSPEQVLGKPRNGAKIIYVGDIADTNNDLLLTATKDADCLIIEGTYHSEHKESARKNGHITAEEAAKFAVTAGVKSLFLNHIHHEYTGKEIYDEAKSVFDNSYVPNDFDHYRISWDKPSQKLRKETRRKKGALPKPDKLIDDLDNAKQVIDLD